MSLNQNGKCASILLHVLNKSSHSTVASICASHSHQIKQPPVYSWQRHWSGRMKNSLFYNSATSQLISEAIKKADKTTKQILEEEEEDDHNDTDEQESEGEEANEDYRGAAIY